MCVRKLEKWVRGRELLVSLKLWVWESKGEIDALGPRKFKFTLKFSEKTRTCIPPWLWPSEGGKNRSHVTPGHCNPLINIAKLLTSDDVTVGILQTRTLFFWCRCNFETITKRITVSPGLSLLAISALSFRWPGKFLAKISSFKLGKWEKPVLKKKKPAVFYQFCHWARLASVYPSSALSGHNSATVSRVQRSFRSRGEGWVRNWVWNLAGPVVRVINTFFSAFEVPINSTLPI